MSPTLERKIVELYKQGMTLRTIGESLGISHEAVRQAIPKSIIRRNEIGPKKMKKVMATYKKCGSYQKTADILNLPNRQAAYRIVLKAMTGKSK